MSFPALRPALDARAFSLVELLMVICLIIVLAVLALPAFSNISRGSNLTTGGTRLVDQLELARQTAVTRNCMVEFRIYQLPKAGDPPTGSPSVYRAFQVFSLDADGTQTNALTRVTTLPDNIYIVPGAAVSSLLDTQQGTSPVLVTAPAKPLGAYPPGSYRYVSFRFKPNGGTDLNAAPAASWHLSLAITGDAPGGLGVPANFFTVQLNALTAAPACSAPRSATIPAHAARPKPKRHCVITSGCDLLELKSGAPFYAIEENHIYWGRQLPVGARAVPGYRREPLPERRDLCPPRHRPGAQ